VQEFDQLTRDAQHPKGSTWTEKYGNLSLSCDQSSSRAAEQRSRNTHLVGTAAARASALCPRSLESNGEAAVVAPVLARQRQEKRPPLDIFASAVHLKSPKRMKSGVDMIWDRMFGANALDLSLHKPRSELNAEEKKARKTAKNTIAKIRLINLKCHIDYFCKGSISSRTDRARKRRSFRVNSILSFCHNDKHDYDGDGQ